MKIFLIGNIYSLTDGHSPKAGCLAGVFRQMGLSAMADEISSTMKSAGYDVRESNPFEAEQVFSAPAPVAPIMKRIRMLWESTRPAIIETFRKARGMPKDARAYLHRVDEIYKSDAYHSLSVECYSVSPEVIEKLKRGDCSPEDDEEDRKSRDALAARGYWADRSNQQGFFEVHSPTRPPSASDQRHYVNFPAFSNGILLRY